MSLAHRHAAAVPGVEIADQADPLRVGRPDRKGNALDAIVHDDMRAELLVAGEMVAFDEQVDIEIAEHRRGTGDVVEFMALAAAPYLPAITARCLALLH